MPKSSWLAPAPFAVDPARGLRRRARSLPAAVADDGSRELARDNFGTLPWTSAADRVCCRRMPPRCREHLMPGFIQIIRPRTSAAVSAPGTRDLDGYDWLVTGHRRMSSARPPTWSPRDAACTACPPPASPRSPGPPGGRSPNQPPTIHGQCCGAPPTPPTTCRPSSAAQKPCPADSAGSSPRNRRCTDRPGYGASSCVALARAVTAARSAPKCLLPVVSKAQAAIRPVLPLRWCLHRRSTKADHYRAPARGKVLLR